MMYQPPSMSTDSLALPLPETLGETEHYIRASRSTDSLLTTKTKRSTHFRPSVSEWDLSTCVNPGERSNMLIHSYMICGANGDPSKWIPAPLNEQNVLRHRAGALNYFWRPEVLGTTPPVEDDLELRRTYHAAVASCYPNYFEVCTGSEQPASTCHSFVLRGDSDAALYGVTLRVWTHANKKKSDQIDKLRQQVDDQYLGTAQRNLNSHYWTPSALCILSRYPLYDLFGDYLKETYLQWKMLKQAHLAQSEDISRLMRLPPPSPGTILKLDSPNTTMYYNMPVTEGDVQNFALWPLFACLPISAIAMLIEVALHPMGRIIFISRHIAMLNVCAESLRYFIRCHNWNGSFIPVAHAHNAEELVHEQTPYILGFSTESRDAFVAPKEAIIVNLDTGCIEQTAGPMDVLTSGQRIKLMNRLATALGGHDTRSGVPVHYQVAYSEGKALLSGSVHVKRDQVKLVQRPDWWNQEAIVAIFDRVCKKATRNGMFGGKKPLTTTIPVSYVNGLIRDRNAVDRETRDVWEDLIDVKKTSNAQLARIQKKCNLLVGELDRWKTKFEQFQEVNAMLTNHKAALKEQIEMQKKEKIELNQELETRKDEIDRLQTQLLGNERQRDEALSAIIQQQIITEELEKKQSRNAKELSDLEKSNAILTRDRDDARRILRHLHRLLHEENSTSVEDVVNQLRKEEPLFHRLQSHLTALSNKREWTRSDILTSPDNGDSPPPPGRRLTRAKSAYSMQRGIYTTPSPPLARHRSRPEQTLYRNSSINKRLFNHKRRSPHLPIARHAASIAASFEDSNIHDKIAAVGDIIRKITEQCADVVPDTKDLKDNEGDVSMTNSTSHTFDFSNIHKDPGMSQSSILSPSTPGLSPRTSQSSMYDTAREVPSQDFSPPFVHDNTGWMKQPRDVNIDEAWSFIDELYDAKVSNIQDSKLSQNPWVLCTP